ncbi:MAG: hypothetical protein LWW96_21735 [Acidovorax sp.]|uniref:hypothetical protein n=1 Tax=Acidovorax sp. TaxID=1872122 RepID=UPI0025C5D6D1|nr:hypothetical protein [Acidovorax sp.]MCE1194775.1 hypothetical protein [Acidovorax sp.]
MTTSHNPHLPLSTMLPFMLSFTRRLFGASLALLAALALGWTSTAHADAGHDHGEAHAAPATALPRFAATSEDFELVGVLQGQHLSLYLDRAPDNSPVDGAQITLEVNGTAVPVQAHGTGEYEATLPQPLPEGEHAIAATVVAGAQSDLLAAALDLHGDEAAHAEAAAPAWRKALPWAAGLAALMAAIAIALVATQRARRTTAAGGAA